MNLEVDVERLLLAHKAVRAELLSERAPGGYWVGEIGSSPVATAAAVSALVTSHRQDSDDFWHEKPADGDQNIEQLVQGDLSELLLESVHWLARRQNEDGGWGDCDRGESNIAATMLVQAAFRLTGIPAKYADLMVKADQFVAGQAGIAGLKRLNGKDKAFLAPVLANCALADMNTWRQVPTLSFEWASLPKHWLGDIRTPAARFATPVVMAVGLAKFHHDPPRNPITRLVRHSLQKRTLAYLARLQAADDSFLASPLHTAFVVMNLASIGLQDHPIVERGIEFLLSSVRADASWSVGVNRAITNTTFALESLSANAFGASAVRSESSSAIWHDTAIGHSTVSGDSTIRAIVGVDDSGAHPIGADDASLFNDRCLDWLLKSQRTEPNPLTDTPAGGWAHSDAPGALPNTLATAGALLALHQWCNRDESVYRGRVERAVNLGIRWMLDLQKSDGGWPTYRCEDSSQQFDDSGIDLTAQALRALAVWQRFWKTNAAHKSQQAQAAFLTKIAPAIERGILFLEAQQRDDGSFIPIWFGNEHQLDDENPVMGTAQVLMACADLQRLDSNMATRAAGWLVASQHTAGGWGPPRVPVDHSGEYGGMRSWRENDALAKFCSIEETAASVSALISLAATDPAYERSVSRGLSWLATAVEQDAHRRPAILGFYFSRIWYYERLSPLAFAAGALTRAVGVLTPVTHETAPTR